MRSEIEQTIDLLPLKIIKTLEVECQTCGKKEETKVTYNLQLALRRNIDGTTYLAYYKSDKTLLDGNNFIGVCSGFGKETMLEALQELKNILIDEGVYDNGYI